MKEIKRKIRQEKLAKLFYEMGMDVDLIAKISNVEKEKIIKLAKKNSKY